MPSTFAGPYLLEPADFDRALDEEKLIQAGDDPKSPTPIRKRSFDLLTQEERDEVIPRINGYIETAASEVHIRARAAGFVTPLSPVDRWLTDLAARLVRRIAYDKRGFESKKEFVDRLKADLDLLESGRGMLYARDAGSTPVAAVVHNVTSAPRVFSRSSLRRF